MALPDKFTFCLGRIRAAAGVRAGIVENAEDYLYSSARFYAEKSCLLDIVQVVPQVTTVNLPNFFK